MIVAIGLVLGIAIAAAAAFVGRLAFDRQADLYQEHIATLRDELERARNEAKVFRNLLFPVLTRAEAGAGDAGQEASAAPNATNKASAARRPAASPAASSRRGRVPFRFAFNKYRRDTNSKQQRTDALADAIEAAKSSLTGETRNETR